MDILPEFQIRNLGYDDNIFTDEENRESDFTGEFVAGASAQLRLSHRAALSAREAIGVELFLQNTDQSNVNNNTQLRGDLLIGPLLLSGRGEWDKRNLAPGAEFDARPERRRRSAALETWLFLSGITDVSFELRRRDYTYADEDFFSTVERSDGSTFRVDLGELLDHEETRTSLRARWKGLPRTRLSAEVRRTDYTFDEPRLERDADDRRYAIGAETLRGRSWDGRALLGFVDFRPDERTKAGYEGLFGDAEIRLRFLDRVEMPLRYERDLEFSSFDNILFYIRNQWRVGARVHLRRSWWVLAGYDVGRTRYGDKGTVLFDARIRRDRIEVPYAGFGFRMGSAWEVEVRVGVRKQDSNYPPADDRQFFIRNGLRRRF